MKSIVLLVAALAGLAVAAPAPDVDVNGRKVIVTFCNKPKLNGNCHIINDFSTSECGECPLFV